MQIWLTLILAVQLLAALAMIGLVLIQHGKGADMGASFGSGASGSLFGASGSANFLSRSTAALATVFFLCTLALAYLGSDISMGSREGGSVLDRPASAASEPAAGAIPGAIPGAAPAAGNGAAAPAGAIPAPAAAASR
ncbi:MAG: preprotein translocase subunit SecG [Rubrivivax sp.]|nr:preprotein translocase subunit SecG [Rubrivivax sp.]